MTNSELEGKLNQLTIEVALAFKEIGKLEARIEALERKEKSK